MTPSPLPLELIQLIIDMLAHDYECESEHDTQTLKNCALTCWLFLPTCRKHLFALISIDIEPGRQTQKTKNLVTLLQNSPEVANYTRSLYLSLPSKFPPLPTELKLFSRLESYAITLSLYEAFGNRYHVDFDKMGLQNKEILLHPILTHKKLLLHQVKNFPFYELLLCCPNVRQLALEFINIDNIFIPTDALPLEPIKLESFYSCGITYSAAMGIQKILNVHQSDNRPIISLSGLQYLEIICKDIADWTPLGTMFLQRADHFVTVKLKADFWAFSLDGLADLLLPHIRIIKEIVIDAGVVTLDQDPLCDLCEELEILGSQPNVLEVLSFQIMVCSNLECSTGDEWRKLDQVIDRFTWPLLKKIQLHINLRFIASKLSETADFRRKLDALPEAHLPKLFAKARRNLSFGFSAS